MRPRLPCIVFANETTIDELFSKLGAKDVDARLLALDAVAVHELAARDQELRNLGWRI